MTRSDLVNKIHSRFPVLTSDDAKLVVSVILEAMSFSLAAGDRMEVRGFGNFELAYRRPRIGRNPRSGDKVQVPGRYHPRFKAGKELRERVSRRRYSQRVPSAE